MSLKRVGLTTVFVTHDQDEALSMSDRIVVMDQGRIRQIGTPEEIYQQPADLFVADFVGTANVLIGKLVPGRDGGAQVWLEGLGETLLVTRATDTTGDVRLAIRPEQVVVHPGAVPAGTANVVTTKVLSEAFLGDHYRYVVSVGAGELVIRTGGPVDHGAELTVELPAAALRIFPGS